MTTQVTKFTYQTTTISVPVNSGLSDNAPSSASISDTTLTIAPSDLDESGTFNVILPATQIGSNINGTNDGDKFGSAVALDRANTALVIGAYEYGDAKGQVKVYQFQYGNWQQLGPTITGTDLSNFGYSVDITTEYNGAGQQREVIIAVGGHRKNSYKGSASIYYWHNRLRMWLGISPEFTGASSNFNYGWAVSLSSTLISSKIRVAISSNQYTADNSVDGAVQVYERPSSYGTWPQLGPIITNIGSNEKLGHAVSLNHNGTIVACSSISGNGKVYIYTYSTLPWVSGQPTTYVWAQLGQTIEGDAGDIFGQSISLNYDSTTIAIGAIGNRGTLNLNNCGTTRIYRYNKSL